MTQPQPDVPASRSRTVTGRSAGTVSSSRASGATSTAGSTASGSQRPIGSSRARTPSRTSVSVRAPPIGLVIDAMRNSVSSRIGERGLVEGRAAGGADRDLPADAEGGHVPGHAAGGHLPVEKLPHLVDAGRAVDALRHSSSSEGVDATTGAALRSHRVRR